MVNGAVPASDTEPASILSCLEIGHFDVEWPPSSSRLRCSCSQFDREGQGIPSSTEEARLYIWVRQRRQPMFGSFCLIAITSCPIMAEPPEDRMVVMKSQVVAWIVRPPPLSLSLSPPPLSLSLCASLPQIRVQSRAALPI